MLGQIVLDIKGAAVPYCPNETTAQLAGSRSMDAQTEVLIGAGRLAERSASDAPCHLGLSEAEAWANGWNAASQALDEMLAAALRSCAVQP